MAVTATEEELEALRKATVSGVQSVEADGRKVVYRSLDDQLRVLGDLKGRKRRRKAVVSSGWQGGE